MPHDMAIALVVEYLQRICQNFANQYLIIMATHGRSEIGRWVYGSVADKVLKAAKTPALLIRCV